MNSDVKIDVRMHLYQVGSIAYAARELALALARAGCDARVTNLHTDYNCVLSSGDLFFPGHQRDLEALASRPVRDESAFCHVRFTGEVDMTDLLPGLNVFMYPWDFDPNHGHFEYVDAINERYDAYWGMSQHTLNAYVNIGVLREKAYWVPHGVNTDIFHPDVRPAKVETDKRFKFLFLGLPIRRKGIDVLMQAYVEEFSASDDVCLVIKTKPWNWEYLIQCRDLGKAAKPGDDHPEVLPIFQECPYWEIPSYYAACDCFVFPTRGESFGLSLAEAMACGKPVITTRWGGATDFCRSDNSYLLDYRFGPAGKYELKEARVPPDALWAEPDKDQLRRMMRHVYEHRDEARAVGWQARRDMANFWTWDHAALRVVNAVHRMNDRTARISGHQDLDVRGNYLEQLVAAR